MFARTAIAAAVASLVLLNRQEASLGAEGASESREMSIHVADEQGKPVADAQVGVLAADQRVFDGRTDLEGSCLLHVPQEALLQIAWAMKPGVGVDYFLFEDERGHEDEEQRGSAFLPQELDRPLTLTLGGVREVRVRVLDEATEDPLPGSIVTPWYLFKAGKGGEFNVSGLEEFSRRADEHGVARFDILPVDNEATIPLLIRSPHHVAHRIHTVPPGAEDAEILVELVRKVSVSGRVVAADGTPASNATVLAAGDGYHYGYFRTAANTLADGTFELEVSPEEYYSLVAHHGEAVSRVTNLVVRKGQPVAGLDIALQQGTRVFGQVTVAPDMLPVADYELKLRQRPTDEYAELAAGERLPNPGESRDYIQPVIERTTRTDAAGRFEFVVGPGSYYLVGPFSAPVPRFTITDEEFHELDLIARDREEFTLPHEE